MFGKTNNIHFVGIGGIGMSGMAELLYKLGFNISGSDLNRSERTDNLKEIGLTISEGHSQNNVNGADVVVYSSAVQQDNPEIVAARKKQVPVIRRAEMLAELLKVKPTSIAISGTHGKTTTCSMLGEILTTAELSPTMVIGGIVNKFQSNTISGSGNVIVVEFKAAQIFHSRKRAKVINLIVAQLQPFKFCQTAKRIDVMDFVLPKVQPL